MSKKEFEARGMLSGTQGKKNIGGYHKRIKKAKREPVQEKPVSYRQP